MTDGARSRRHERVAGRREAAGRRVVVRVVRRLVLCDESNLIGFRGGCWCDAIGLPQHKNHGGGPPKSGPRPARIAEEAEAPAGSDGAALRRRLAEPGRACSPSRGPAADAPPPPRRERRPPDPLRPHNAPAAAPAKPPAPPAAEAPDVVAAAAGRLAEAAYRAPERLRRRRRGPPRGARKAAARRRRAPRASGACWGRRGGRARRCLTRPAPPPRVHVVR